MKVDVWSDIACPWCYIGKRRFAEGERLYRAAGGDPVEVEYHSFELSPDLPDDFSGSVIDYLHGLRGMPRDQVLQIIEQVTGLARAEGIDADFRAVHQTRTLKAHELLHLAKSKGLQERMKERLLRAYFVEGGDVSDLDQLADVAVEVGLDRDEVLGALAAGTFAEDVRADIDQARAYGVSGVPFYVIDGRFGISGAQPAETFAQALAQAAGDRVGQ
ncbi:MAG TPA: DsbA family oxidoreductase [Motilibacterales bacterium]|nr:DsbA family oxidoreductase [Motilibacterales bacterium]